MSLFRRQGCRVTAGQAVQRLLCGQFEKQRFVGRCGIFADVAYASPTGMLLVFPNLSTSSKNLERLAHCSSLAPLYGTT
jgi:hypothetical protein